LLVTDPRISQLAGMVKHYAPLKAKFSTEMVELLATTDDFGALPEWLQVHLLKVEELFEEDKRNAQSREGVEKHRPGEHDQARHAGRRASTESIPFTDSEVLAVQDYTARATLQVNGRLRGKTPTYGTIGQLKISDNKLDSIITNLDSAIDKSTLTEAITLGRDIPIASVRRGILPPKVGQTISEKGFLSMRKGGTQVPPSTGFARLIVTAPAGTKALDMSFMSQQHMGEVIFPRNSKIKITNVIGSSDDMEIRGEIVG